MISNVLGLSYNTRVEQMTLLLLLLHLQDHISEAEVNKLNWSLIYFNVRTTWTMPLDSVCDHLERGRFLWVDE